MSDIIYGQHSSIAWLTKRSNNVQEVWVSPTGPKNELLQTDVINLAKQHSIPVIHKSLMELDELTRQARHQSVALICQPLPTLNEKDLIQLIQTREFPPLLLVLDGIQDPHNLGACLRTADAAGVAAVIVPKDRAVGLTSTVHATACGATATVPFVQVTNLVRCLKRLKAAGVWLMGMDATTTAGSLYAQDLRDACAIVIGCEATGLRRLTRETCDYLLKIPMYGNVSSLNASVATAICLFEAQRQRN